jgi:hypothetical protein
MSRIATITTILTLAAAPAAPAAQDLRSPDARDLSTPSITRVVDLRSPDARDVFTAPTQVAADTSDNTPSAWAFGAIAAAALASCAGLGLMLRRHRQVGRPVGV